VKVLGGAKILDDPARFWRPRACFLYPNRMLRGFGLNAVAVCNLSPKNLRRVSRTGIQCPQPNRLRFTKSCERRWTRTGTKAGRGNSEAKCNPGVTKS
jgi:hypothetical protein